MQVCVAADGSGDCGQFASGEGSTGSPDIPSFDDDDTTPPSNDDDVFTPPAPDFCTEATVASDCENYFDNCNDGVCIDGICARSPVKAFLPDEFNTCDPGENGIECFEYKCILAFPYFIGDRAYCTAVIKKANTCYINDVCYDDGEPNLANDCEFCNVTQPYPQPASKVDTWSSVAAGEPCTTDTITNGTCTATGVCECVPDCTDKVCGDDGCGGSCFTAPLPTLGPCEEITVTDNCTPGVGECGCDEGEWLIANKPVGTACDDNLACTTASECNIAGVCEFTACIYTDHSICTSDCTFNTQDIIVHASGLSGLDDRTARIILVSANPAVPLPAVASAFVDDGAFSVTFTDAGIEGEGYGAHVYIDNPTSGGTPDQCDATDVTYQVFMITGLGSAPETLTLDTPDASANCAPFAPAP